MDKHGERADIALLLEGTYPYVRGGVSAWVHDLIEGLAEYRFALVFLGAKASMYDTPRYTLPSNVVSLSTHMLMEPRDYLPSSGQVSDATYFSHIDRLHDCFRQRSGGIDPEVESGVMECLVGGGNFGLEDFLFSKASWRFIADRYQRYAAQTSFVDYFWTVRSIHAAVFKLAVMARQIPPARAFHAVSTGYAGLLGALLRHRLDRPLVLTEHGIYTKERKIDLQAAYVDSGGGDLLTSPPASGMKYHHHLWIRFFEGIGRLTYSRADPIIALYDRNGQRQIRDGADPSRTRVIPNGIDLPRFVPLRARRPSHVPAVLGLIGRVVPIKDIKTFIRAMRSVCTRLPQAQGWLIGPDDEDPEYAQQCRDLVRELGLDTQIKFLGFQKIDDMMPQLGLLVLTSISEAFPLVVVEAFASGLPVLTTDVGACREIVEGAGPEDRALGPAGAVVPIASPEETAKAAVGLLTDAERWRAAQRAGIERVERYYTRDKVLAHYRGVYQAAIAQ